MAVLTQPKPEVALRLSVLRRQIAEAQSSLSIHLTLHEVVGKSPKTENGWVNQQEAMAFRAISNATMNNLIVMTHQIFDGTKPSYSLRHAKGDKTLIKAQTDTDRLRDIFKNHKETIDKVKEFRNQVAAHASIGKDTKSIVDSIKLDIWAVKEILKAAAECVDGLFLANPILGMQLPDFEQESKTLEAQLKEVFSKGFG